MTSGPPVSTAAAEGDPASAAGRGNRDRGRLEAVLIPICCYALSTLVVLLGIAFGRAVLQPSPYGTRPAKWIDSLAVWDGGWYFRILVDGYSYDPARENAFAFFPAYPMLARAFRWLTRSSPNLALVATSHACFALALVVFYAYARRRMKGDRVGAQLALLSMGLLPTTFFFRAAYAESLLLLIVVLVLYGIASRWPAAWIALLAGLGTAVRPSGAALLFPLALYLFPREAKGPKLLRLGLLAVGCWGLLAFMAFAAMVAHDPIAFVHAQAKWHVRPHVPLGEKIEAVLTFAAVRGVYAKGPFYWRNMASGSVPALFNLYFANSFYFAGTILAVVLGALKGWLDRFEVALAIALVGIPYLAHNYETSMMATGRYMTTVVPTYLVLGHLLRRLPPGVSTGIAGVSAFLLGAYAALFGMWYWLI